MVALHDVAVVGVQVHELFPGLHALGNDLDTKLVRHLDHAHHNGRVVFAESDVIDEGPVDFILSIGND